MFFNFVHYWHSKIQFHLSRKSMKKSNNSEKEGEEKTIRLEVPGIGFPDSIIYQAYIDKEGNPRFNYLSNSIGVNVDATPLSPLQDHSLLLDKIIEEDREYYFAERNKAIQNAADFNIDVRIRKNSGEIAWINNRAKPRKLDNGSMVWEGFMIDITGRKRAEEALRISEERFRSFVENSHEVFYTMTLDGIFTFITPNCKDHFGHQLDKSLGISAFDGFVHPDDIALCRSYITKLVETRKMQDGIEYRVWHGDGYWVWISTTVSPIFDETGSIHSFQGIAFQITERKNAEDALKKSEHLFRSFVENANDTVFCLSIEGILLYGSPNWTTVLGHDVNDFIGKSVFESLIHPDDIGTCMAALLKGISTGEKQSNIEYRASHKDGGWRWQTTNASPLFDEKGNITSFLGIARDITVQKQAAEALLESDQCYRDMFNTVSEAIYIQDENGCFVDVNAGAVRMCGYQKEELLGQTPAFLAVPGKNDIDSVMALIRQTFVSGQTTRFEFWGKKKDAEVFSMEVICNKGKYFGKDVLITTARDTSERKVAEAAFKQSEERWQFALEGAGDGIWDLDTQTNKAYYSHNWKAMLGFADDEIGDTIAEWEDRIHPDDKDMVLENIKKHYEKQLNLYKSEYRIRCKDGSYKWILGRGKFISKGKEQSTRFIGVHTDITERKLAENLVKENKERFSKIFHLSPDLILLTRLSDGVIVDVNDRAFELSGYHRSEIIGKTTVELKGWDDIESRNKFIAILRQKGRVVNHEKTMMTKSGEVRYANLSAEVIDIKGEKFTLVFIHDVTNRKKAEASVRDSNDILNQTGQLAMVGGWVYDAIQDEFTLSEETRKMLGVPENTHLNLERALQFYLPEDGQKIEMLYKNALSAGEPYTEEFNMITATGRSLLAKVTCKPVYEDGIVVRLMGAVQDITEMRKTEKALAAQQLHNQQLITELTIQEQESERQNLSSELNDDINQVLAAVKMQLSLIKEGAGNREVLLNDSYEKLNEAIKKISSLSNSIDTPSMIQFGFIRSVELLIDQLTIKSGLTITLRNECEGLEKLPHQQNLILYRIIQEKLNNVIEHAKATAVSIVIRSGRDKILLSITDNGIGFDMRQTKPGGSLQKIQSRVKYYKGKMSIISAPGKGCTLEVSMPAKL